MKRPQIENASGMRAQQWGGRYNHFVQFRLRTLTICFFEHIKLTSKKKITWGHSLVVRTTPSLLVKVVAFLEFNFVLFTYEALYFNKKYVRSEKIFYSA